MVPFRAWDLLLALAPAAFPHGPCRVPACLWFGCPLLVGPTCTLLEQLITSSRHNGRSLYNSQVADIMLFSIFRKHETGSGGRSRSVTGSTPQVGKHWHLPPVGRQKRLQGSQQGPQKPPWKGGVACTDRRKESIRQISKWTLRISAVHVIASVSGDTGGFFSRSGSS